MSRSTDKDHFFQTSQSLQETTRKNLKSKNTNGSPIRLRSKILAVIADHTDERAIYVAESAGTARRLVLDNPGKTTHIYRGPTTPIPCLALSHQIRNPTLFAGSWDKSIWSWSTESLATLRRYHGHSDFVTALCYLIVNSTPTLISGSADASIILWDISTGSKLQTLTGHTRGILFLAIDPATYPSSEEEPDTPSLTLFSIGSDRSIRRWSIPPPPFATAAELHPDAPLLPHETSIYALVFSSEEDELYTASADGTCKALSRQLNWFAETTFPHGDYVRAVVVDERGGYVVTAGRDENVKVWERGSGKVMHVFEGHFEEITGLVLLEGQMVVSVGIDMTVRRWSLKGGDLAKAIEDAERKREGVGQEELGEGKTGVKEMTEEEEKELEELMSDDS